MLYDEMIGLESYAVGPHMVEFGASDMPRKSMTTHISHDTQPDLGARQSTTTTE